MSSKITKAAKEIDSKKKPGNAKDELVPIRELKVKQKKEKIKII